MKTGMTSWKNLVRFVWYYFSIPQLFKTLIAPWKGDTFLFNSENIIQHFVENTVFSFITRVIGFVIRFFTILVGIFCSALVVVLFPIFVFLPISLKYNEMIKAGSIGKAWSFPRTDFLDKHSREMRYAPERFLPQSRQKLMDHMERILVRGAQPHVLLVGEEGVGKTTFLEQFAMKIHWGLIDPRLNFKRVVQLIPDEMNTLDLERAFKEAARAKNIILVIDGAQEYKTLISMLMPYLESQSFLVILSTTLGGFEKVFKRDTAFMRFTEKIDILPPEDKELIPVLHDYLGDLKSEDSVPDDVLEKLITLTNKYIVREVQPVKSIEILDTLLASKMPITLAGIEEIISDKTRIPLGAMERDEASLLLKLEEEMQKKIVGQRDAIHDVAEALKRSRSGIGNIERPVGAFLFLGPTGVGKTYTAQVLAEIYFGDPEAMIRFDMSEYRELETLDRFIERATVGIEENPFSLFFIDEIEKAHPDILNLFLQIFDEGRLTGLDGVTVSFDSSIIICTSNAGSKKIQEDLSISQKELVDFLITQSVFRPEFLNRFDAITLFAPLSEEQVLQVTELMLQSLNRRIQKEKNIRIDVTSDLVARVAKAGFDPQFGARPIRRAMQDIVENQLAEKILRGEVVDGSNVSIQL